MLYKYNKKQIKMTFNFGKYNEILGKIKENIKNNPENIEIIAVSKNHGSELVREAINCGLRQFGENRVQEAISKFSNLKLEYNDIILHLTGPLQTNKVKDAIKIFDVFHTLDREKLANELKKNLPPKSTHKFFIQVNTGLESQKSGILPKDSDDFISYCKKDLGLSVVGLMCIPPIQEDPTKHFKTLRKIAINQNLKYLSMGMSSDYVKAIECGATHIRIGTLLFGKRLAQ